MKRFWAVASVIACSWVHASSARAEPHVHAPASGGLGALDVRVSIKDRAVEANGTSIPIGLAPEQMPEEKDVQLGVIAIGRGRSVVHVRVPSKAAVSSDDLAWEAILSPNGGAPIMSGLTGWVAGDPGERSGQRVEIVPDGSVSYVLVGDQREDLRLCGQGATLLEPRALYPDSMTLRSATVQRLSSDDRDHAEKLSAIEVGKTFVPPLGRLLVSRGSSVPASQGSELTDGDVNTVWQELRPGAGQGEFVVMSAPSAVPIERIRVVLAPKKGGVARVAPKTFYLVSTDRTFEVSLPEAATSGDSDVFEVTLPQPLRTSCLALVLGSAYAAGSTHPDVGIAELAAYSAVDRPGVTLDDLASRLSTSEAPLAAELLERAGPAAIGAVSRSFDRLDGRGRALAIRVAGSARPCEDAAELLVHALCDPDAETAAEARDVVLRCRGAGAALATEIRRNAATRACIAPVLADVGQVDALAPLADAMTSTPEAQRSVRAILRDAFAGALAGAGSSGLRGLLADRGRGAARLEILRAAGERVSDAPAESTEVATELLTGTPTMRVRYLVLAPLAILARGGDAASVSQLQRALLHDPDWPVRARAAALSRAVTSVRSTLIDATKDSEPRVREAALSALVGGSAPDSVAAAVSLLRADDWSFVREQAARVLEGSAPSSTLDAALADALDDASARVRRVALVSLGTRHADHFAAAVRARLEDTREDVDVRAEAARALGALCDRDSVDRLSELARALVSPELSPTSEQLGAAALVGLSALHPVDMNARLAPLLAAPAPDVIREAALRALAARPSCGARSDLHGSPAAPRP